MAKTHYSPKTKKIERCSGKCAYGEDTPHFGTIKEGNEWLVAKTANENSAVPKTIGGRAKKSGGESKVTTRDNLKTVLEWDNVTDDWKMDLGPHDGKVSFTCAQCSQSSHGTLITETNNGENYPLADCSKCGNTNAFAYQSGNFSVLSHTIPNDRVDPRIVGTNHISAHTKRNIVKASDKQ